jgi:hypothetical protein
VVADGRVYQGAPEEGLIVLDANSGKVLWRLREGGDFLVQFAGDAYLLAGQGTRCVARMDAATGKLKASVEAGEVQSAVGHPVDQSFFLASRTGELMCLRSRKAPKLKPSELAEVLQVDRKARLLKEAAAKRTAKGEVKPTGPEGAKKQSAADPFEEFDWLRSKGNARPLGARPPGGEDGSKKPAKPKKEGETDEGEGAKPAEAEEEEDEDASSEKDEEEEDEEATGEEEEEEEDEEEDEEDDGEEEEGEGEGGEEGGSGGGAGGGGQPPAPAGGGKRG